MTEEQVCKWMEARIQQGSFTDAASLARDFLEAHKITDVRDPNFSLVIDAGLKMAGEIAGLIHPSSEMNP